MRLLSRLLAILALLISNGCATADAVNVGAPAVQQARVRLEFRAVEDSQEFRTFGKIPDELQGIVPQTAINGSRWLVSPEVLMSEADVATATLIETAPDELGRRFEAI